MLSKYIPGCKMASQSKIDYRIVKSKTSIRAAFLSLLAEKPLSDLTISEITKVAGINRKTFYAHYKNIYDIIDEFIDGTVQNFAKEIMNSDFGNDLRNPYVFLEKLNALIYKDFFIFNYIMQSDLSNSFIEKIVIALKSRIISVIKKALVCDEFESEVIFEYVSSGMISVYKRWFLSKRDKSLADISGTLSNMMFLGLKHYES
jgi:AcrR family transcriptional regulator